MKPLIVVALSVAASLSQAEMVEVSDSGLSKISARTSLQNFILDQAISNSLDQSDLTEDEASTLNQFVSFNPLEALGISADIKIINYQSHTDFNDGITGVRITMDGYFLDDLSIGGSSLGNFRFYGVESDSQLSIVGADGYLGALTIMSDNLLDISRLEN